jgi:hypothetical protein
MLGFDGPRTVRTLPLVGTVPGVGSGELGQFELSGLPGEWVRPFNSEYQIELGRIDISGVVEASDPETDSSRELIWTSRRPVQPSARLLNIVAQARLQDFVMFAAIAFGVGGSIIAAVLLEALWPRLAERAATARSPVADKAGPSGDRSVPTSRAVPGVEPLEPDDPGTPSRREVRLDDALGGPRWGPGGAESPGERAIPDTQPANASESTDASSGRSQRATLPDDPVPSDEVTTEEPADTP